MASTGQVLPGSAQTVNEAPYSSDPWVSPGNVTANDATYASITAATFDSPDQGAVLKAYNFNLAAVPDSATILGVTVRIEARYANGTAEIDLVAFRAIREEWKP